MSRQHKFNASISTVGIKDSQVRKVVLTLQENVLSIKETSNRQVSELKSEIQQLRQQLAARRN